MKMPEISFKAVKQLVSDERGGTLVEYGLLIALIAIASLSSLTFLEGRLHTLFSKTGKRL